MGTISPEVLERLAAAVMGADPDDEATIAEVRRALEAAAGVGDGLFAEAASLGEELARPEARAAALQRVAALVTAAQSARPAAAPAGAAAAQRDPDTIELIGDFLEESTDGLARVDVLLLEIERNGPDPDKTNALFRVFHTIKGVAGFLELRQIVVVSHTAEALLNLVREGRCALAGGAFEVIFDATALLRRMLEKLRAAVDAGVELLPEDGVDELVARIQAEIDRVPESADAGPPAPPSAPPPEPGATTSCGPEDAPALGAAAGPGSAEIPPAPVAAAGAAVPEPPPAGKVQAAEARAGVPAQLRETVKVDLERVDAMVEMIGELIIVESMVVNAPELRALGSLQLRNNLNKLTKISRDLQNVAMRMRMVPVRGAFQKMGRLVRDLARKTGKDIVLECSGEDTEMDRSMVERIEDPLVHMIRNSVDHGIETAAERVVAGKPARATLRLSAYHEGGSIVVELHDDGRGLQRDRILAKAREKRLVDPTREFTDAEICNLIFLPGFSTAAQVTEISGRGVGMDVVKRNVEGMRGRVSVASVRGQGTTFRMVLPLTLAVIDGMLVSSGKERYIIPSLAIVEALRPTAEMVRVMAGRGEIVNVRGEILPLLRLHRLLQMPSEEAPLSASHVVVVEGLGRKVGLVVEEVIAQQQVVIKPLGDGVGRTDFLAGAAILADGKVGLILNVDKLASLALAGGGRAREAAAPVTEP